jgi:HEXXH motif-containing protein
MTATVHSITSQQVRALAEGTSTQADLALLANAQLSKCLTMLALTVRDAAADRHPETAATQLAWKLLVRVQRATPEVVDDLLRYPAIGAWATRLVIGGARAHSEGLSPGQLALISSAAAIRGGVSFSAELPRSAHDDLTIHFPSLGTAVLPHELRGQDIVVRHGGGTTEISGRRGRLVLPHPLDADTPDWRALHAAHAESGSMSLRLVIDDANPHRIAGPIKPTERLDAGQRDEWRQQVAGGWRILTRDHQRAASEVHRLIRTLVPLATDDGASQSVTSRYTFGSIGLSLPGDDVLMALTLVHEVQHAKLSALMDLLPLANDAGTPAYYAPWRPDPRPLASLLQGLYAHLAVARFWRLHREVASSADEIWHASVEFAKWRNACAQVVGSVRSCPELTRCGAVFVDGAARVLREWRHDNVPPSAQQQASAEIREHRRQWDARYRPLMQG